MFKSTQSMPRTPSMVFKRIGQAQEKKMTKIFISSPKPKNNSATGITTGGGTGRSISTITAKSR